MFLWINRKVEIMYNYFMNKRTDFYKDFLEIKNKKTIYLNSSATSLKPKILIEKINSFYKDSLWLESNKIIEETRQKVKDFINAKESKEIVFNYNATACLNIVALGLETYLKQGDEIILSPIEHSSNLLPWINLSKKHNLKIKYLKINNEGIIDISNLEKTISSKTKIVAINHISNTIGGVNDIKKLSLIINNQSHKIFTILDASQSVGHMPVDVEKMDIDFMVFAPHKMFALQGVGVLYGKEASLNLLEPIIVGGGTTLNMEKENFVYQELPFKLEPGTQNVLGIYSLQIAINYINDIGVENIWNYNLSLQEYAKQELLKIKDVILYNKNAKSPIVIFNIKNLPAEDLKQELRHNNIFVRSGQNCSLQLKEIININSSVRISFNIYNSKKEIDELIKVIKNRGDSLNAFF